MNSSVLLLDYETRGPCLEALEIIRSRFRTLESVVPEAQWVPWGDAYNWQFVEQNHEQLLIQKLARQVSGVQTIDLLLMAGRLQEVGVLYRMLDEIAEDILFIVLGLQTGKWTADHQQYANYFWSDDENAPQPPVQRKKIRAYINRAFGQENPAHADSIGRTIHKTFSDFVHARSAPIMGMVKGPPARFDLDGVHSARARSIYVEQNPTYFYRCLMSVSAVANVLLIDKARMLIFEELKTFEQKYHELIF